MKRVVIFVFLSSLLLFGCDKTSNDKPQLTQGEPRPGITGALSPSATPTPSTDPLFSPSPTLTPIPEGKLLGWLLVEERSRVDGETTIEKKTYDENNRLIKVECYQHDVSGDVLLGEEEYAYDGQGNCIFEGETDKYGNKSITTYAYEQGKLLETQYCWGDGSPYVVEVYLYLEDGSVRCERRNPDDNTLEDYFIRWHDEEGNVISERFYSSDDVCLQIYEAAYGEHGILWSYEALNLCVLGDTDASPNYIINSYVYDSDGNLLKKIHRHNYFGVDFPSRKEEEYRYENGELVYAASHSNNVNSPDSQEEWRCVFDDSGRLLEKVRLEADGTDSLHKKTYRYDDYGNCIEIFDRQGRRVDIYTYTYEPILETEAAN